MDDRPFAITSGSTGRATDSLEASGAKLAGGAEGAVAESSEAGGGGAGDFCDKSSQHTYQLQDADR